MKDLICNVRHLEMIRGKIAFAHLCKNGDCISVNDDVFPAVSRLQKKNKKNRYIVSDLPGEFP